MKTITSSHDPLCFTPTSLASKRSISSSISKNDFNFLDYLIYYFLFSIVYASILRLYTMD